MRNKMRPIHPGEILREEFVIPLKLSGQALAFELHVPPNRINAILAEKRGMTADTALRLARYFSTTAEFWLNLQKLYELRTAEIEAGQVIKREIAPRKSSTPQKSAATGRKHAARPERAAARPASRRSTGKGRASAGAPS